MRGLIRRGTLAAVVVVGATFGSVASASASGTQVFGFGGSGSIECKSVAASKRVSGSETIVNMKFSECSAFGFPVSVSEAEFTIYSTTGPLSVDNTITFEVPAAGCTTTVGPRDNEELERVFLTGVGSSKEVAHFELEGITYTTTGGFGACGAEGTHHNGTYFGEVEI